MLVILRMQRAGLSLPKSRGGEAVEHGAFYVATVTLRLHGG